MKRFLLDRLFQVIITLLLSVLTGTAIYFIGRVEDCEARIRELEIRTPTIQEQIRAIDDKLTEIRRHLSEKMDVQYAHLRDLIESHKEVEDEAYSAPGP